MSGPRPCASPGGPSIPRTSLSDESEHGMVPHLSRGARPLGILLVVGLVLAGCSGTDPSGTVTTPGSGSAAANAESDAGPVRTGGKIVVGVLGETDSYNPFAGSWSPAAYVVANALFDPLASIDPEGRTQPYLAESFKADADFRTWTIGLRRGVTFHDGSAVDAAAVKRNLETARTSGLTSQAFTSIASVDTPDDHTVVVGMNRPWSSFPSAMVTQAGYVAAPSMLDDPAGGTATIVGSGPFRVVERQNDKAVRTERNASYWQTDTDGRALPYLDGIDFRIVTDPNARVAGLKTGDLDASLLATGTELAAAHEAVDAGQANLLTNAGRETDELVAALNTSRPPFDDPVARRAVALAIDQDTLAQTVYQGQVRPAWGMFEEGSPWYLDRDAAGVPAHDVDAARSLADEYARAHGTPLRFSFLTVGDTEALALAQTIQAQLEQAGIGVDIQTVDLPTVITRVVATGDYQAAAFAMWSSPSPDQGYIFVATPANPNGLSLNYSRLDDPELKAAMDAFRATGDQAGQKQAMDRVQQRLGADLQMVFLTHSTTAFQYATDVHGFTHSYFPGTTTLAIGPYATTPFYTHVWVSGS